jgi:hypothetical protein
MRHFAILIVLTFVAVQTVSPVSDSRAAASAVTLYDPNPSHIWNRLHEALFVRKDASGAIYGSDSLDPLLWLNSTHLLSEPSHRRALRVLDEFLQTHAENLIRDPVKRAVLQRDLWAIFDWSIEREPERPEKPEYEREKRELQTRLAEALRRLALTSKQIESLPDNYAQAVVSGNLGKAYDPAHRDHAFLPPDLFDQHGPWVEIEGAGDLEPVALQHLTAVSGRSRFLVFMRLPGGRKATFDYLRTLWEFPQPWVVRSDAPNQTETNPNLPSFPVGTEVALVRQMTLFDDHGNLVPAPITESVQIRVYRRVTADSEAALGAAEAVARDDQDFYEVRFSRSQLFTGTSGGLRAVGPSEREFLIFNAHGDDQVESSGRWPLNQYPPVLRLCAECHRGAGIQSLNTREVLLKPRFLQQDATWTYPPRWWENDGTIYWKQQRYDWGLLNGYWSASERLH